MLQFQLDHAEARDAVHERLDVETLTEVATVDAASRRPLPRQRGAGSPNLSAAPRSWPRTATEASRARLASSAGDYDIAFVIADGLSARAVSSHADRFAGSKRCRRSNKVHGSWRRLSLVEQGRVAIGDEIGEILGARLVAVLIGERPGLSSP